MMKELEKGGHMDKVVVISVDAMICEDLKVLRTEPCLRELFGKSAVVSSVMPVFPSLTFPCHVSMLTGCHPMRHGVINNEEFSVGGKDVPWIWFTSQHREPTLFHFAREAGLSTASIGWPSTSGCPDVDYLVTGIYARGERDELDSPCVQDICDRNHHLLEGLRTDNVDEFVELTTREIIMRYQPDLTLCYLALIDSQRHKLGYETEKHVSSLQCIARRIARIVEATKEAGVYDETTFFITSDHGQINNRYTFSINEVLRQKGYIELDEDGNITDWRIYAHSSAFTAEIYTRNITDSEARKVLEEIGREYPECVDRILTRYETRMIYHTDGDYTFMIEGVQGVSFGGKIPAEIIMEPGKGDFRTALATHGHSPERGPKPVFMVLGKRARDGIVLEEASLVDEAPTVLKVFGIDMPGVDGHSLDSLLEV